MVLKVTKVLEIPLIATLDGQASNWKAHLKLVGNSKISLDFHFGDKTEPTHSGSIKRAELLELLNVSEG